MRTTSSTVRARSLRLGLLIVSGATAAACAPDRTMLVAHVDSDLPVPAAMDSVRVDVAHDGKMLRSVSFALGPGAHALPIDVGLLSPSGSGTVDITASGWLGGTFVVEQEAITSFVTGKSLVVDVFLAAACAGVACPNDSETCIAGPLCSAKARPVDSLHPFDPARAHDDAATAPTEDAAIDGPGSPRRGDAAPAFEAGTVEVGARDAAAAGSAGAGTAGMGGAGMGAAGAGGAGTGGAGMGGAGVGGAGMGGAGMGGAGMSGTDAGTDLPPGCKVENCFDGIDNDCDGLIDCADPDCFPTVVCVPHPSGLVGTTGVVGEMCPSGFANAPPFGMLFGLTVQGGGASCTGCQCGTSTTSCSSSLTTYGSAADCQAGTNGKAVGTISSASGTACGVPDPTAAAVFGASLAPWTVSATTCPASGTPVRPTASFATSTTFCQAATVLDNGHTGCPAGSLCMRRAPTAGGSCVLLADASACPAGTTSTVLYAGLSDDRTCGACTCQAQGASCDALVLQMGAATTCDVDTADVRGGMRACVASPTGVAAPGYRLAGKPTAATCTPTSALSGAVTPTGARSLCCLP